MVNFYIYLAVVISGGSVLAVEILGTRIIGPFYGVSLYLWSALISVTLAALSIGYVIGGRIADQGAKVSKFSSIIGLAGVWIMIIPWIQHPILESAEALGLRTAVLVTATILFLPPLTLLGMVSPYAIRLKAQSLNVVGRTAGNLYAMSTVASVIAAVCTGFFLIPNIGVSTLTFMIGILLFLTAALGFILTSEGKAKVVASIIFIIIGSLSISMAPQQKANPEIGLIDIRQSAYAELRVVDQQGARYMLIDGGSHTIVNTANWESLFPYVDVLDISNYFFEEPGEMLLIGLGGGSVVKNFYRKDWNITAVEIDPVVTDLAYEYFGLEPNEAEIFHTDGRQFLIENEKKYNLVIMDAFGSSSIPFHLVTKEAFGLIKSRLDDNGMLAMNIEAVGWHHELVHSLAATLNIQFKHVKVLPIAEPPNTIGNLILLASDNEISLDFEFPVPYDRFSSEYNRTHAWDNRFDVDTAGIQILTDQLNPVDVWAERINIVARKNLHQHFKTKGLGW